MPPEKTKSRTPAKTANRKKRAPTKTAPTSDTRAALKEIALAIENPPDRGGDSLSSVSSASRAPDTSVERISDAIAHRSLGEGGIAGVDPDPGGRGSRRAASSSTAPDGGYDISRKVLARIVSLAAQEIDGHEPPRRHTLEKIVDSIQGRTDGIRVAVAHTAEPSEDVCAVDMLIRVHYGSDIPDLANRLRERIARRIHEMTGLEVVEMNLRIQDVTPA